jgi:predicted component of type VI protein secretion system
MSRVVVALLDQRAYEDRASWALRRSLYACVSTFEPRRFDELHHVTQQRNILTYIQLKLYPNFQY